MKIRIDRTQKKEMIDRYESLKRNTQYVEDYKKYYKLEKELPRLMIKGLEDQACASQCIKNFMEAESLEKKWGMKFLVKPTYKIKTKEKITSIQPGTPLANIIYAFGISNNPNLLRVAEKKKQVSDLKHKMDERIKKFLCYSFIRILNISYSALGRLFQVDKNTIRNWINEVNEWSDEDKENVLLELRTSKNYSRYTDVSDILHFHPKLRDDRDINSIKIPPPDSI